jgi:hypothetical protein
MTHTRIWTIRSTVLSFPLFFLGGCADLFLETAR